MADAPPKPLRVAVVQFEHKDGDKVANFAKIEDFTEKAAAQGVKLIVFPECCMTGYWHLTKTTKAELLNIAEFVPGGSSSARLQGIAKRNKIAIGAGLIERDQVGKLYNTYIVAVSNGALHKHRKIQAFEHESISAGDQFTVFDLAEGVRVGVLLGDDNCVSENVRITALIGAQVLLAPHQTGGCHSASPHGMKTIDPELWYEREANPEAIKAEIMGPKGKASLMNWLPARAHDNGMFLLFANGIGLDDDEVRTGNSMILDPYGHTIGETNVADDAMVISELDLDLVPMSTGRRWLQARRPEIYAALTVHTGIERDTRAVRLGSGPTLAPSKSGSGKSLTETLAETRVEVRGGSGKSLTEALTRIPSGTAPPPTERTGGSGKSLAEQLAAGAAAAASAPAQSPDRSASSSRSLNEILASGGSYAPPAERAAASSRNLGEVLARGPSGGAPAPPAEQRVASSSRSLGEVLARGGSGSAPAPPAERVSSSGRSLTEVLSRIPPVTVPSPRSSRALNEVLARVPPAMCLPQQSPLAVPGPAHGYVSSSPSAPAPILATSASPAQHKP